MATSGVDPSRYWLLIAVLSSTMPLSPEVANRLYQAAHRLYREEAKVERIQGDLLTGKVVRLDRDMAIGTITGPAFEAEITTPRGDGVVRFLLTRQGLDAEEGEALPKLRSPATRAPLLN